MGEKNRMQIKIIQTDPIIDLIKMKIGFGTKIDEVEENDNEAIVILVEHQ